MTEINELASLKDSFQLSVQPQCRECIRPMLLRDRLIEQGLQRPDADWEAARIAFAGYIALCPREVAPKTDDTDQCLLVIEDRRCQFDELARLDTSATDTKAADILSSI